MYDKKLSLCALALASVVATLSLCACSKGDENDIDKCSLLFATQSPWLPEPQENATGSASDDGAVDEQVVAESAIASRRIGSESQIIDYIRENYEQSHEDFVTPWRSLHEEFFDSLVDYGKWND